MLDKNAKIYVAGHRGMVGSAIVRRLQKEGYEKSELADLRKLIYLNNVENDKKM